jgi:glyceraldehyde 3-phosphate dehydrogenase
VSCVDLCVVTEKAVAVEEVNALMKAAAEGPLKGVLGFETRPLVSMDYNHQSDSSIFAADQTKVLPGNLLRVLSWYDNEWGFSNRMADTAVAMGKLI